jgi:hypothetical protein
MKALGFTEGIDTFKGRLQIQKSVLLLNEFGAKLGFAHHWYIHGPYSPALTRELFNQTLPTTTPIELDAEKLRIVNDMRNFLGEDLYSVDSLELIVSLIYLIKGGPGFGFGSKHDILKFLREAKPHFSQEQMDGAWTKIERSGRWQAYLTSLRE